MKIYTVFIFSGILCIASFFSGCSLQKATIKQPLNETTKTTRNVDKVRGSGEVYLSVEVEYTLNSKGYLNNDCQAQFIVTNIGTVPYLWKEQELNKIVFEFSTTDDKIIETTESFFTNLQPGRTAPIEIVQIKSGLGRFCTGVKAVRIEK